MKNLIHTKLPSYGGSGFWLQRHRFTEKLAMWVAWHLPRIICHWCAVRLFAHATQGKWGNEHPESVTVIDAMKRWS